MGMESRRCIRSERNSRRNNTEWSQQAIFLTTLSGWEHVRELSLDWLRRLMEVVGWEALTV